MHRGKSVEKTILNQPLIQKPPKNLLTSEDHRFTASLLTGQPTAATLLTQTADILSSLTTQFTSATPSFLLFINLYKELEELNALPLPRDGFKAALI